MKKLLFLSLVLSTSSAWAEASPQPSNSSSSLIMIVVMILFFYMFMIRPQNKKAKEHRDLMNKIGKGDEVMTASGLIGQVIRTSEQFVVLNLAEGVEVKLQKNAIATTLPKGTIKSI